MSRKGYSSRDYECLFDLGSQISISDLFRKDEVLRYRTKTITSGKMVECEIYPIWKRSSEVKKAKEAITPEAQKNVNDRNAKKKLIRKLNANFDEKDISVTLTYSGDEIPNKEQARRDVQNYLRRIKDVRKHNNLTNLKYIYVIEYDEGTDGKPKKRIHHHIVMSGMDRDAAEQLWTKGYANCHRLQPNEYGLEALARYMIKDPKGFKRWNCSRNLKEPIETIADHKVTVRQVERIATQMEESAGKIFGSKFPGCDILNIEVKRSDHVAGAYIYAKMHQIADKHKRRAEQWQNI